MKCATGVLIITGFLTAMALSAQMTFSSYSGTIPTLDEGSFYYFPSTSSSAGAGNLSLTSMGTGSTMAGNNTGGAGNFLNTGFGTDILLVSNSGETFTNQILTLAFPNGFDDGFRIDYNGSTVLEFSEINYVNDSDLTSLFNGNWSPWTNQGNPVVEINSSGIRMMITAESSGTGSAAGIVAGQRINLLEHFTPQTYVPSPGGPDFQNGVSFAVYDRNGSGPWALQNPLITAGATVVPEPSYGLIQLAACMALMFRRRTTN